MGELIQCPKCGLRQTSRHAYCSRCEHGFTGELAEDLGEGGSPPDRRPAQEKQPEQTTESLRTRGAGSFEDSSSRGAGDSNEREGARSEAGKDGVVGGRSVRNRGSLSRRFSTPASAVPEAPSAEAPLPSAPAWRMPKRQSQMPRDSDGGTTDPVEPESAEQRSGLSPRIGGQADLSGRDFMVRGRPQGELYASERSPPPRDPLLADLVAGRVSKEPSVSDEFARPVDWDQPPRGEGDLEKTVPRRRQTGGSIRDSARVDAPSMRKRSQTNSEPDGRSRSLSGVHRPRSGQAETPPRSKANPGESSLSQSRSAKPDTSGLRDSDFTNRPLPEHGSSGEDSLRAVAGGSGARAPGQRRRSRVKTTPGGEVPARTLPRRWAWKEVGAWLGVTLIVLFTAMALADGVAAYRAKNAITRLLNEGIGPNGPTADLPKSLERTFVEFDVTDGIETRYQTIDASSNSYVIGVRLNTPVVGYPMRWSAIREGDFDVRAKIRTLDVFVAAGWSLDLTAQSVLDEYKATRNGRRQQDREDAPGSKRTGAADDDDSSSDDDDSSSDDDVSTVPPEL